MKKDKSSQHGKKYNKYEQKIDDQIDLHGMSLEQAKEKVQLFLSQSKMNGYKKVLVITGKGIHSNVEGVLYLQIPLHIRSLNYSCVSAKMYLGGNGAIEVSL